MGAGTGADLGVCYRLGGLRPPKPPADGCGTRSVPPMPLSLTALLEAGPLAELLSLLTGHDVYLVGGLVRDALLGRDRRSAFDIDLATSARPEQVLELVTPWADAVWDVGREFGTIACRTRGQHFEITTFRSDTYASPSRKPNVAFAGSIEDDLVRRDLTVNALALRLPGLELVDPTGGVSDLAQRVLRTPLAPETTFGDDPLRMLRVARFVAQLPGFGVEPVSG